MTPKFSLPFVLISLCFLSQFVHCHPKLRTVSNGVMMFKRTKNTTSTLDTSSGGIASNNGGDSSSGIDLKPMPSGWDTSGKYFASVWDNKGKGTYSAKGDSAGKYEFKWQSIDDAIVGKGFRNGTKDRVFTFDGEFEVTGNGAYLALYGWSVGSKCVEYYVVDNWGQYPPCGSDSKGTLESDGDTYTICTVMGGPCVDGSSQTHIQYWSRRHTKRSKGTITFANHVSAWEKAGMVLGTLSSPQILAVEAYAGSSGSATITISASGSDGATDTSSTAPASRSGTSKDTSVTVSQGGNGKNSTDASSPDPATGGGNVKGTTGTITQGKNNTDTASNDDKDTGSDPSNGDSSQDYGNKDGDDADKDSTDDSSDYTGKDSSDSKNSDASQNPSTQPNGDPTADSSSDASDPSKGETGDKDDSSDDSGNTDKDGNDSGDDASDYGKDGDIDDSGDSTSDDSGNGDYDKEDPSPNGKDVSDSAGKDDSGDDYKNDSGDADKNPFTGDGSDDDKDPSSIVPPIAKPNSTDPLKDPSNCVDKNDPVGPKLYKTTELKDDGSNGTPTGPKNATDKSPK